MRRVQFNPVGPAWRALCLFGISLFFSSVSLEADPRFRGFRHHYRVSPAPGITINWTGGFILSRASARLPRIIFDPNDPDYGRPNTVSSISRARAWARRRAREKAILNLMRALGSLRLNSNFRLLDRMKRDADFRERMANLRGLLRVHSRRTGEGRVSVEIALPFFSERGLYSLLTDSSYSRERPPRAATPAIQDRITGLIIDVREFRRFRPSLEVRIYSDRGKRIYGPEIARRSCVVRRGLVSYYLSKEKAEQLGHLGFKPYFLAATGLTGGAGSDVFISSEEVERILGSRGGRAALRNCAVAFIVNKEK